VIRNEFSSFTDFLTKSSNETIDHGTQTERQGSIIVPVSPLSRQPSHNVPDRCPQCKYQFRTTVNEPEIINQDENRLPPSRADNSNVPIEPNQYLCPYCEKEVPGNDELVYLHHLSICCNEPVETF
jgi:hypothetical protein